MRTRRCWEKSKRGGVCREKEFLDTDARLDHARKYGSQSQSGDGRRNYPTVGSSIHDFMLDLVESYCSRISPSKWTELQHGE